MQNNDSRLIKAAKRTIRAEITLVIVIIVIASWSVYALYKLAFGGTDTVLGLSLTKFASSTDHPKPAEQRNSTQPKLAHNTISSNTSSQLQPIYFASTLPTSQRSQHLDNIRGLIVSQDPARHSIENGLNHQLANINHLVPPSIYNPDRLRQTIANLNNGQSHSNQLMSAQLIGPTQRNPYGRNNIPPVGRSFSGRELDYESNSPPDYGPASPEASLDYSSDRLAEESNRDSGESVVGGTLAPSGDEDHETTTREPNEVQDEPSTAEDDDLVPETTTMSPAYELDETAADHQDVNKDQAVADQESSEGEPGADDEETSTPEDNESVKAAGLSIDEEVDRMTQPSLGSISQQDKPMNFNKATVQFDDSPGSSLTIPKKRLIERGSLVAQFADPQSQAIVSSKKRIKSREPDLQVDHNIVRVGSAQPEDSHISSLIRALRRKSRIDDEDRAKKTGNSSHNDSKKRKSDMQRQKRDLAQNIIRAPYEIDGFLKSLDISHIIEKSFEKTPDQKSHDKPSMRQEGSLYGLKERPEVNLDTAFSETVSERLKAPRGIRKRKAKNSLTKRSDDEEEDEDDDEGGDAGSRDDSGQDERGDDSIPSRSHRSRAQHLDLRNITSNDAALQNLLNRQHLLDALKNSQPPAPIVGGSPGAQTNQTAEAPVQNSSNLQVRSAQGADHQPAGSLYSIDHGLLLYPASNDDYASKSMSKKKKKHEKKKEKKKTTVAVKKGGHKKKKHKKEEKKYLKEKKFKGAKKGKKVAKGKGGQGGKKGKKLYKDKGFKKKGFKNVYHKEEFGQKKSYFDEFRDKDYKKKWKKFDDKYNYAQMKKWQAKDIKGAKKMKDHGEKFKKFDNGKWKKKYHKQSKESSAESKKHKKSDGF